MMRPEDLDTATNEKPYLPQGNPNSGNMIEMTDPEIQLTRLEYHFRGYIPDDSGNFVKKYEPIINDKGINKVMSLLRSVTNPITFMTNLEETDVENHTMYFADALIKMLMINKREFEINNDSDRTAIVVSCVSLARMSLRRGLKEGERRFWKGSSMEITQSFQNPNFSNGNPNMGNPKKGLQRLFPW